MISDRTALDLAVRQARRGKGQTGDNPSVGCLLLSPRNEVLALCHTAPGGRPHAEALALSKAGRKAKGATAYVTLEPCAHHGRSGPCVDALLAAQVARVVVGTRDANPIASGGLARLQAAGIEAQCLDHTPSKLLHLGFNRRAVGGKPYIIMKIATSADGGMTRAGAMAPIAITGEGVRAQVHLLRSQSDLIVTGSGTMRIDQPQLTVRLPGYVGSQPKIHVWRRSDSFEDLKANQVMIEAGPTLCSALFAQVDELHWYRAPDHFGSGAVRPSFLGANPLDFASMWPTFGLESRRAYGRDMLEIWRRKSCSQA